MSRVILSVASFVAVALSACLFPGDARAVPSFAQQTGQPCAACHVGAYGPQLKKYARDFKLFGYVAQQDEHELPPIAFTVQTSFTHTNADQQPGATPPHVGPNDNFVLDQASLYYAGRITPDIGAFAQITYDGVGRDFGWDNTDIRAAMDRDFLGHDVVGGVTLNNSPTVTDLWNSTPTWGYPYIQSAVAPTPAASALIDGLGKLVSGAGAYAMIDDLVYLEFDAYKGLGRDVRNALGTVPVGGTDSIDGIIPYWRVALQKYFDEDRHYFEVGAYGLAANIFPQGLKLAGTDHIVDNAVDFNYQWIENPKRVTSQVVSAHATYIRENLDLNASQYLSGTNPKDDYSEFRADVSYSWAATWTPTVQYFQTWGTTDAARWGTPNGSPNSEGFIAEIGYVPWGKPDSPLSWLNMRVTLQYVAYTRFDGSSAHASDNNALYLNLWFDMAFNRY